VWTAELVVVEINDSPQGEVNEADTVPISLASFASSIATTEQIKPISQVVPSMATRIRALKARQDYDDGEDKKCASGKNGWRLK
jgi:hypothetical protein